jgi:hypothetical protein
VLRGRRARNASGDAAQPRCLAPQTGQGGEWSSAWAPQGAVPFSKSLKQPRAPLGYAPPTPCPLNPALTTQLGKGAFGRVFKATWDGEPAAVKVLQVAGLDARDPANEQPLLNATILFHKEAETMQALNHP